MDINDTSSRFFKMVETARMYCLIEEMSRMSLNEPDIFELADEIRDYFDDEAEPMDTD
jgi:hypothetical protein